MTDHAEVAKLRAAIREGNEVSVCFLNYRRDGSTFWNQVGARTFRRPSRFSSTGPVARYEAPLFGLAVI